MHLCLKNILQLLGETSQNKNIYKYVVVRIVDSSELQMYMYTYKHFKISICIYIYLDIYLCLKYILELLGEISPWKLPRPQAWQFLNVWAQLPLNIWWRWWCSLENYNMRITKKYIYVSIQIRNQPERHKYKLKSIRKKYLWLGIYLYVYIYMFKVFIHI
jgi:hypothetical protein